MRIRTIRIPCVSDKWFDLLTFIGLSRVEHNMGLGAYRPISGAAYINRRVSRADE